MKKGKKRRRKKRWNCHRYWQQVVTLCYWFCDNHGKVKAPVILLGTSSTTGTAWIRFFVNTIFPAIDIIYATILDFLNIAIQFIIAINTTWHCPPEWKGHSRSTWSHGHSSWRRRPDQSRWLVADQWSYWRVTRKLEPPATYLAPIHHSGNLSGKMASDGLQ